ncbi:MAG TPA: UvrD-helicase domain-containing protein [Polyangiaceae bacterium]|nr:UvrD-helicase domain-containing protein [Polyangiaceae bacterium]
MSELNPAQLEAVVHESGPLLVFAGAGSGKTRTIIFRIANLLANHHVPPFRILAVTFTNKAAGEMRARLELLAGPEVTRDLWIGTFHAVCARLLRRYHEQVGLERDFVIYDDADQKAVLMRLVRELGLDEEEFAPKLLSSLISREKREGRGPEHATVGELGASVREIYARYERKLLQSNAVDFDDLIGHMTKIAESNGPAGQELRGRFSHVLVDEFQDTNLIQYRLVRSLSALTRNLCVVGDDDQAIYRWRGADVRLIRSFERDFPDAYVVKLEQNYRSTSNIVSAALGVIQGASQRVDKKLWTEAAAGEPVRVRLVNDEREEAAFVTRSVQTELARGVRGDEIAIFYRVHAQSRALEEALRSANVPYQVIGGTKFFERAEVKDLIAYLRLIVNPRSDADLLRAINVPPRGIGEKTVERLLDLAGENSTGAYDAIEHAVGSSDLPTAAKKKLKSFRELVERLRGLASSLAPSALAHRVLEESGYRQMLSDADDAESDARLGNLEELVGSIADYEAELENTGEEPTLGGYLERITLVSAVDAIENAPKVSLMTVHTAKGLEYRTVFLTGMEEEIFPYRGVSGREPEELDEERRLAYVAITRARTRLFITHVQSRTLFGTTRWLEASRFLADLPPEVISREGPAQQRPAAAWGSYQGYGGNSRAGGWQSSARGQRPVRDAGSRLAPGTRVIERDEFEGSDEEGRSVHPGDIVRHKQFGRGVVERVDFGAARIIVARFGSYGVKHIRADYLELE